MNVLYLSSNHLNSSIRLLLCKLISWVGTYLFSIYNITIRRQKVIIFKVIIADKKSQIPITIAATEIIITNINLLSNLDKVDLLSSEMGTHYIRVKIPFNAFMSNLLNIVFKIISNCFSRNQVYFGLILQELTQFGTIS